MRAIFRIECDIGAGFVEAIVEELPFTPSFGMSLAPLPDADPLKIEDIFWFADKPNELEIWLVNEDDHPWAYWKKQGFKKGANPK